MEDRNHEDLPENFNPFRNRDHAEVWKEIKAKAVHITKEEFFQHIEELRRKKAERERKQAQEDQESSPPAA